jgi:hypothetical protein
MMTPDTQQKQVLQWQIDTNTSDTHKLHYVSIYYNVHQF